MYEEVYAVIIPAKSLTINTVKRVIGRSLDKPENYGKKHYCHFYFTKGTFTNRKMRYSSRTWLDNGNYKTMQDLVDEWNDTEHYNLTEMNNQQAMIINEIVKTEAKAFEQVLDSLDESVFQPLIKGLNNTYHNHNSDFGNECKVSADFLSKKLIQRKAAAEQKGKAITDLIKDDLMTSNHQNLNKQLKEAIKGDINF